MKKILIYLGILSLFVVACSSEQQEVQQRFPLSSVHLMESPFYRAQQADLKYILALDPDRLLAPYLIDAGFDILNPVQCSAADMDPKCLKDEFGDQLVFWGGGIDTQKTLPFGTPEDVYNEVRQRIEIFNKNSGFIFNSIHNVQSNVPTENLLAMFKAIDDARK